MPDTTAPSSARGYPPRRPPDTVADIGMTAGGPQGRPGRGAAGAVPGVGSTLGKYRLTAYLGEGSTCRVYRGEHVRLPLAVAVKVFHPTDRAGPADAKLRDEAAVLAGLNHPNVIRLWDFDDDGPHPYLVTELVDGRTLAKLMDDAGPLLPDWALFLALQVIDGLEAALKVGVVHRDVKPANILLAKDGTAKLADLGTALLIGRRPAGAGGMAGTAAYVAPEQARDAPGVDHRADIYSLGATLYHAVTGRMPFPGRSVAEVVFKHLTAPIVPPHEVTPAVPRPVSDAVTRMLAKAPADRFATYADLRRCLLACLAH